MYCSQIAADSKFHRALSKGIAILFHRIGEQEIAAAHDARTGKEVWKSDFPANYSPTFRESVLISVPPSGNLQHGGHGNNGISDASPILIL